ncbi:MAG: hypothetical protein WBL35_17410 [Ornithinibacter sp.]
MILLSGATTARDLLFGGHRAKEPPLSLDLGAALDQVDPSTLGSAVRESLRRDVSEAALGLLELDLTDVLVAGWTKHSALRAAGRRTKAAPGTFETVQLAEHRISWEATPYVDVLLSGLRLGRLQLTLGVTVDVTGLAASVSAGRLAALVAGDALVEVSLSAGETPVASRSRRLDVHTELGLGDGLRLA